MVHKRGGTDRKARLKFVHWSLHGLLDRELDSTLILFGDERRFNLSAYLNSPNNRYCSTGYTLLIHEVCDVKVGVWCDECSEDYWAVFYVCDHSFGTHTRIDIIREHVPDYGRIFFLERHCSSSHHMQFYAFTERFWGQHQSGDCGFVRPM